MKKRQIQKLISKYNKGKATNAERLIVDSWYMELDAQVSEERNLVIDQDIIHQIMAKTTQKQESVVKSIRIWRRWQYTACIAIAIVGIAYIAKVMYTSDTKETMMLTYQTGSEHVEMFILPDGSTIELDTNTCLTISTQFGKENREVDLSGEAFFDVTKNKNLPFVIKTKDIAIKVLGTSFNVNNRLSQEFAEVQVRTGLVEVSYKDQVLGNIKPDYALYFNKRLKKARIEELGENRLSYTNNSMLVLKKASFEELSNSFNRIYGIELYSSNPTIIKDKYNITLRKNVPLKDALLELNKLTDTYTISKEDNKKIVLKSKK